jgi:asparagine synthetase B (glutamine-hydrolysing)
MKNIASSLKIKGDYIKHKLGCLYKDPLIISNRNGSIIEIKEKRILIHADVTGIDKVYFEIMGNKITISNTFKDFLDNGVNGDFMEFQLAKGYVPYPFTLLKDVWKAPPGLVTELYLDEKNRVKPIYYASKELDIFSSKNKFIKKDFRDKFTRILLNNGIQETQLVSSFSGGFDSLLLTNIYLEKTEYLLHFSEDEKIDINYYKSLFKNKKWVIIDGNESFSDKDSIRYFKFVDEPCCDASGFAEYLMIKRLTSEGINLLVMNGQGNDALFANGRKYFQEYVSSRLPEFIKSISLISAKKQKVTILSKIHNYSQPTESRFKNLYLDNYPFSLEYNSEISNIYKIYQENIKNDSTNFLAAITLLLAYSNHGVEKIRTAAHAFKIRYYLPFMSKDIIQYAFSVPASQKIGFKHGKKILMRNYEEISRMKFSSKDFKPQLLKERLINEKLTEEKYKEYFINRWMKYSMR